MTKVLHAPTVYLLYSPSNPLLELHLNNESKPANIIDQQFVQDLSVALDTIDDLLKKDRKIAGCLIVSDKKNFLVGADIHSLYREVHDAKLGETVAARGQALFDRLAALPIPTVAAINELALGGGLELALACSYRVLSANGRVGLPEVKLGVIPGAGGTVRTPRLIGLSPSLQMILPGGTFNAKTAKARGLVDYVVSVDDSTTSNSSGDRWTGEHYFLNEVRKYAQRCVLYRPLPKRSNIKYLSLQEKLLNNNFIGRKIVAQQALANLDKQTGGRYPAPYLALDSVYNATKTPNQRSLMREAQNFGRAAASPESKNLMSVFFMSEDAKKVYKQSRLPSMNREQVTQLLKDKWSFGGKVYQPRGTSGKSQPLARYGVIGAGVMGAGIGHLIVSKLIEKHTHVFMKDVKEEFVKKGMSHIEELLKKRKRLDLMKYVTGGIDMESLAKCDIVIEAAVEHMDIKKKILQATEQEWINQLQRERPGVDGATLLRDAGKIFCTNTSTLSITELASVSLNPANVVGLHFFNPVHRMPLIEIVRGDKTSDETVVHCYNLSLQLGKTPIVVNDGPGFLVNRILGIFLLEAQRLMNEGFNIQQVDQIVKHFGLPMGCFRLLDEVGLDVAAHSAQTLTSLGERFRLDPSADQFPLSLMIQAGQLGKKSGAGIYNYKKEKKNMVSTVIEKVSPQKTVGPFDGLNPKLPQIYPQYKGNRIPGSDVIDRMILMMINEAAMILQEGIATSAQDVDIGMIFGTGFAPFRGGLLSHTDALGTKFVVRRLQELRERYGSRFEPCEMLVRMAQNDQKFFPDRVVPPPINEAARPPRPKL